MKLGHFCKELFFLPSPSTRSSIAMILFLTFLVEYYIEFFNIISSFGYYQFFSLRSGSSDDENHTILDSCNGRVRRTDGRYVYHMRTSPPYLMGCFRGALGLGVAHGKSLSKRCPEVVGSGEEGVKGMEGVSGGVSEGNLVVVNNWRSWSDDTGWSNHSAMHHTTQSMCNVASKVSLDVFIRRFFFFFSKYLSLGDNFFFFGLKKTSLILLLFVVCCLFFFQCI